VTLITLVLFWGAPSLVDGVAALIGGWHAKFRQADVAIV
jgi:hypothetical protein